MAQSKKNKSSVFQKMVDTPFMDFDTCCICKSHNGPFVWVRFDTSHQFVCEDCYSKLNPYNGSILKAITKPLG